jgi:hypothetical protein
MVTVSGAVALMALVLANDGLRLMPNSPVRKCSMLPAMAAASQVVPSWKRTPGRTPMVHTE